MVLRFNGRTHGTPTTIFISCALPPSVMGGGAAPQIKKVKYRLFSRFPPRPTPRLVVSHSCLVSRPRAQSMVSSLNNVATRLLQMDPPEITSLYWYNSSGVGRKNIEVWEGRVRLRLLAICTMFYTRLVKRNVINKVWGGGPTSPAPRKKILQRSPPALLDM